MPFSLRRLVVLPYLAVPFVLTGLMLTGCAAGAPVSQAKIVFTPEASQTAVPSAPAPESPPQPMLQAVPKVETEILPPLPVAPAHPSLQTTAPNGTRGLRVALLAPLTGPNASLGAMLSNAAQLALFDTTDDRLELQPIDTKGTAVGAVAAINTAIEQGADLVLGPIFSGEVKAIAPIAQQRHLPVLAFTTDKTAVGNGVYTLGLLPDAQAGQILSAIRAEGRTRIGLLAPDTEYGHAMVDAAQTAAAALGLNVTKMQFYPSSQTDFRALAQSFADYRGRKAELAQERNLLLGRGAKSKDEMASATMPFDALLLPDVGLRLKNLVAMLTYYGIDPGPVRFLGTMRWEDRAISDEPMLQGAWYAAPPQAGLDAFEAHYVKTFGPMPKPLVSLAGESYDGLALAALLDKRGAALPANERVTMDKLTDTQGFAGVVGLFRLRPDGGNDRGLAVREVAKDSNPEVVAAPAAFSPAPAIATPTPDPTATTPATPGLFH